VNISLVYMLAMPLRTHPVNHKMRCVILVSALLLSAVLVAQEPAKSGTPKKVILTEAALKIHGEALVIDGHNDLPWELRRKVGLAFRDIDLKRDQPKFHTDIPRLKKGNVGAQFWSAYVPADTGKKGEALRTTLEQIDVIHRLIKQYPETFGFAGSTDDVERIRKSGKIASLIGIEGGHSIEDSIGALRMLYKLGVRYMTLTHSESLAWADSATDKPRCNGLSPFGEEIVREMNAMGMLVDLSHVSPDCMKAALKVSQAPVIYSHSSARGIADHPRNVPDDVLPLVKANGGVIMVNFFSGFIVPEGARAMLKMFDVSREMRKKYTDEAQYKEAMREWMKQYDYPRGSVYDVCDHIDHLVKGAGVDHVGLGSDYDGITKTPLQLEDVSCYPYITQELLNRGYSATDIKKILGGNVMRAFKEAEKVSARLSGGQR
jgi:membrane dipeptidase